MAAPIQPDTAIVAAVIHGDTDAYAEIMARYEQKLERYVLYLVHDTAMARDIVQETFIRTYQNLRSYNPKYKFSSWIYRIAHNQAMNALKKDRHIATHAIESFPDTTYDTRIDELIDAKILHQRVQACLNQLAPKYREVVQLIYFENMKYEDAGDVLRLPVSTIGVRLARAKAQLLKICKQIGVKR